MFERLRKFALVMAIPLYFAMWLVVLVSLAVSYVQIHGGK